MIENIALYREFGKDVTLKCSSEGCPRSVEEYTGMYLYLSFNEMKEEVLYYYKEVNVREKFQNRIQTKGSLRNSTITISNLTVEDAGSYQCVYTHISKQSVRCKAHTLVVRGAFFFFSFSKYKHIVFFQGVGRSSRTVHCIHKVRIFFRLPSLFVLLGHFIDKYFIWKCTLYATTYVPWLQLTGTCKLRFTYKQIVYLKEYDPRHYIKWVPPHLDVLERWERGIPPFKKKKKGGINSGK